MIVEGFLIVEYQTTLFETLELNTPGFFFLRSKEMTIDYTKLNDKIVEQAFDVSRMTLSEELKTRLLQDKIKRAAEMIRAREMVYHQIED
jgi:hypothetical protein